MTLVGVAAAWLVGALPIGFVVARAFGGGDIRRHGSGNIGATNVLRTLGRGPAILTLLLDVAKGYAAVALGAWLAGGGAASAACAVVAVAGNCWSPFLGFHGGKGVATGLGALLRLAPWATIAAVPVFVLIVLGFRYVSLASLLAALCVPLGALALRYPLPSVAATIVVAAIVFWRHRDNIRRLLAGTERRLGERTRSEGAA